MTLPYNQYHVRRVGACIVAVSLLWAGTCSFWVAAVAAQSYRQKESPPSPSQDISAGAAIADAGLQGQINVNNQKIYDLSDKVGDLELKIGTDERILVSHSEQLASIHGQQLAMGFLGTIFGILLAALSIYNTLMHRSQGKE